VYLADPTPPLPHRPDAGGFDQAADPLGGQVRISNY
jgi:hypothetical protein